MAASHGAFRADCSNRALLKEVGVIYAAILEGRSAKESGCGSRESMESAAKHSGGLAGS